MGAHRAADARELRAGVRAAIAAELWKGRSNTPDLVYPLGWEVGGQSLRFVHRDDLIRMKLAAGREKDLKDIAALTSHEGGAR
jgi:hypothetical protein